MYANSIRHAIQEQLQSKQRLARSPWLFLTQAAKSCYRHPYGAAHAIYWSYHAKKSINRPVGAPLSDGIAPANVAFGNCIVMVAQRRLLREGTVLELGDRAFELLLTLIAEHGKCVTKDALIARVWPGRIIEENTLEGRISLLRRVLGPERDAIRTIAGRGYQFVADVYTVSPAPVAAALPPQSIAPEAPGDPLPASVSTLIGRAVAKAELTEIARAHRLITLVGTGGIGKTRLAVEVARMLAPAFADGAFLAELGSVPSAGFLPAAISTALGLPRGGEAGAEQMAAQLRGRHLLLVLDNCEHLIGAAALLAERLLRGASRLVVIATSREALRIEGEYVYRVSSLDIPDADDEEPDVLATYGALQLFRARLGPDAGDLMSRRSLALQAHICRRLDGIPLALELAAARVAVLGLEGVAARLDNRFQLLNNGARTALPRQQTLRATLDWSYDLLPASERTVLGHLSIFAGHFSLDAAAAIAATSEQGAGDVEQSIASLVEKSLVSADRAGTALRYKLLETTRAYARETLPVGTARASLARAHAKYYLALFEAGASESPDGMTSAWRARHMSHLEDLRAAVGWAYGDGGDAVIGVRLTLASMPLSLQLGLLEECLARVDLALAWLERHGDSDANCRMKLYAARGTALLYQSASAATGVAFQQALALADAQGDVEYQKRGVWGAWCHAYLNGQYVHALTLAQRFHQLAAGGQSHSDRSVADRIIGISNLCLGRLADSRVALERMLHTAGSVGRRRHTIRFLYDEQMLAHTSLAHTLYLQGYPEQAVRQTNLALASARELGHLPSVCYALSEGVCAIALLVGDETMLAQASASLDEATRRHGSSTWTARSRLWTALPKLLHGQSDLYDEVIAPAMIEIGVARFFISLTPLLTSVALALGEQGRVDDGMALIDPALIQASASGDACSLVELTRAHAILLSMRDGEGDNVLAEQILAGVLARAREQGFLSWELRCALALARLRQRRGVPCTAAPLRDARRRFSEGWERVDLRSANALLGQAVAPR
jgi:predicted ATPase/DNA-binding winged helix-turn-helix (wHTH) protein